MRSPGRGGLLPSRRSGCRPGPARSWVSKEDHPVSLLIADRVEARRLDVIKAWGGADNDGAPGCDGLHGEGCGRQKVRHGEMAGPRADVLGYELRKIHASAVRFPPLPSRLSGLLHASAA